jgi:hypothetical protein
LPRRPANAQEFVITEAPDRTDTPDGAEREAAMTTATTAQPAPFRARPLEFLFSVLGLIVAVIALPFVLLADGPAGGWVLGAALFAASWAAGIALTKLSLSMPPTHAVGISGISFILRAWIIVAILFVVAKKGSEAVGLAAAGVFLAAFSFDLLGRIILHSLRIKGHPEGPTQ